MKILMAIFLDSVRDFFWMCLEFSQNEIAALNPPHCTHGNNRFYKIMFVPRSRLTRRS